jgi:type IV pilus assembly protein PilY1
LLFTAKDDRGTRQPVSTQPKVVFAPGGGYVVLFGSGKFLEKTDAAPSSFTVQSFYGIYDSTMSGHQVSGRDQLSARKLEKQDDGRTLQITGDIFSYESLNGWYFDFPESDKTGERTVTNGVVADGRLFFNTLIPETAPCATGTGRTYILDTLTGLPAGAGSTGFRSTVGILNSPLLLRASLDVGERNATGIREVRKRRTVFNFGTDGVETAEHGGSIVPAGRFSWREIVNWQDLKSQIETKD